MKPVWLNLDKLPNRSPLFNKKSKLKVFKLNRKNYKLINLPLKLRYKKKKSKFKTTKPKYKPQNVL